MTLKPMDEHGKARSRRRCISHGRTRKSTETKHCIRFGLMNDFKAHGLRSMGLLFLAEAEELATDEHGKTEEEKTFLPQTNTEKHGRKKRTSIY